jgi:hypothetical protein
MACVRVVLIVSLLFGTCLAQAQTEQPAPKKPHNYLPVEELPRHEQPSMTNDERANLLKDLTAARDRQAERAKSQESTKSDKPK